MSNYIVIVEDNNNIVSITGEKNIIIETGVQGPPGIDGVDGSGKAIVQDFPPGSGETGDLWFNNNTQNLQVYVEGDWTNQSLDAGYY